MSTAIKKRDKQAEGEEQRRLYFMPDVPFDSFPKQLQIALEDIIFPNYEVLVTNAPAGLERETGVTLVFLLAIEIIDQIQLGGKLVDELLHGEVDLDSRQDRQRRTDRLLRIIAQHDRTRHLLTRIQDLAKKWERPSNVPRISDSS
ncbi:MAG: hypothetical protein N2C12_00935 [Planctomycetales bacterium]